MKMTIGPETPNSDQKDTDGDGLEMSDMTMMATMFLRLE